MKFEDDDIKQLFAKIKDDPSFGGSFDAKESWKITAKYCGFSEDTSNTEHTWRDWLEFYLWEFSHQMMKPAMTIAVFVFLFVGGWIGAANASLGALPGERLYNVKLSMEKVQLVLATSPEQKAQLKTEFTSRRLEELVSLAASSQGSLELNHAVDLVKQNVANIQDELKQDQNTSTQELAKAVGRKADALKSTVKASSPTLSKQVQKEVSKIIEETKEQAVEVMITAHEQIQTEENAHELEITFDQAFALAEEVATDVEEVKLKQAVALKEKGSYRRAFQVLKEIEVAHENE